MDMDSDETPEVEPSGADGLDGPADRRPANTDAVENLAGLSRMVLEAATGGGPADRRSLVCRAGDPPRVLTLREQDRSDTIVATAPFVSEVDDIQREVGRAPCVTAARAGRTVMSGSAGGGSAAGLPGSESQRGLVAVGHPRRCGRGDDGGYPTSRTCSMSEPPSSTSSSRYRR
jgi:hypothetical protein